MIDFQRFFQVKQASDLKISTWEQWSEKTFQMPFGLHIWKLDWRQYDPLAYIFQLSEAEKSKISHYQTLEDQNKYILTRAILKNLSAKYLKSAPKILNYKSKRTDDSIIANTSFPPQFITSHSTDYILIAFSFDQRPVGIDIKENNLLFHNMEIADDYYSYTEKESLACSAPSRQFFKIWTRKEALARLIGSAISGKLLTVNVLDDFIPAGAENAYGVYFKTFQMDDRYIFSLARPKQLKHLKFLTYS